MILKSPQTFRKLRLNSPVIAKCQNLIPADSEIKTDFIYPLHGSVNNAAALYVHEGQSEN